VGSEENTNFKKNKKGLQKYKKSFLKNLFPIFKPEKKKELK